MADAIRTDRQVARELAEAIDRGGTIDLVGKPQECRLLVQIIDGLANPSPDLRALRAAAAAEADRG